MLTDMGFRFVVLHQKGLDGQRYQTAQAALERWFGPARFSAGDWICWDMVEPATGTKTYKPPKRERPKSGKIPKGKKKNAKGGKAKGGKAKGAKGAKAQP